MRDIDGIDHDGVVGLIIGLSDVGFDHAEIHHFEVAGSAVIRVM